MDLTRRLAPYAEAGPLLLGPLLSAGAAGIILMVLGPAQPMPLFALALLIAVALTGLLRFELVFSLFLFYLFFETALGDFLPGVLAIASKDIFYLGMLLLGVVVLAARPNPAIARPPAAATGALLFLVLFELLLVLRGPTLMLGALSFRATAFFAGVAVLTPLAYATPSGRRNSLILLAVGVSAVAVIGLWETLAWQQVREVLDLEQQRWSMGTLKAGSSVGGPGPFGAIMAVGLFFLVARGLEGALSRRGWMLLGGLAILWGTGLVVSFSRISQISLVLVVFGLIMRRPRLMLPGLLLLGIASVIADWATHGFFSGNLLATLGIGEHLDAIYSTGARVEIIHHVLEDLWPQRPWLGFGLGSVGAHTLTYSADSPMGYLFVDNIYLKSLVEGGVLGLVMYLLSVVVPLGAAWKLEQTLRRRPHAAWRRALVRGAAATTLFYALVGTSSTVHEVPVVNVSIWWAVGLLMAEAARQRVEAGSVGTVG